VLEADPQSSYGSGHYKALLGLTHKNSVHWIYLQGLSEFAVCQENPDFIDTVLFQKLAQKYPSVSSHIFPLYKTQDSNE
jgi:hypothetical protein